MLLSPVVDVHTKRERKAFTNPILKFIELRMAKWYDAGKMRRRTSFYATILVFIALCGVNASIGDRASAALLDHFLNRDHAMKDFIEGKKLLSSNPLQAITVLTRSYYLFNTLPASEAIAWAHEMCGEQLAALNWYQKALSHDVDSLATILAYGIHYHYSGDYTTSLRYYDQILAIDPQNADALFHEGVSYQNLGDITKAADYYFGAVQANPLHAKALINLATLHQKHGSIEDALHYYKLGLNVFIPFSAHCPAPYLHPDNVMLRSNLALAYYQMEQYSKVRTLALMPLQGN